MNGRNGRLVSIAPIPAGGYVALDDVGRAWRKSREDFNWEPLETPSEQRDRLQPSWQRAKRKRQRASK